MLKFRLLSSSLSAVACIFASPFVYAADSYVIATPGVSNAELKAYATSKDKLTLSEHLESRRPGLLNSDELKKKFERAQRAWLGGQADEAQAAFRALTELSLKADWKTVERQVLQTSYLRLAQSANSPTEKNSWLESAARFYGDLEPDTSLFPPPLLETYDQVHKKLIADSVDFEPRDVFPESRFLLIDGRLVEIQKAQKIRLAPGVHRITVLGDTHAAVTEFLTGAQLRLFRFVPPLLTEGVCEKARFKAESDLALVQGGELYAGKVCAAEALNLKPRSLANTPSEVLTRELEAPSQARATKKTWAWVVGGALIAGAGYALAREMNRDKSPEPVNRTGF